MKTIRSGMFETNSSSSHVIVLPINPEERKVLSIPAVGKEVTIELGSYGWGYEVLYDWKEKASYLLTWALTCAQSSDEYERLISFLKRTLCVDNIIIPKNDEASIDHQSYYVAKDVFEMYDDDVFKEIIFCEKSKIIIDNDNH